MSGKINFYLSKLFVFDRAKSVKLHDSLILTVT